MHREGSGSPKRCDRFMCFLANKDLLAAGAAGGLISPPEAKIVGSEPFHMHFSIKITPRAGHSQWNPAGRQRSALSACSTLCRLLYARLILSVGRAIHLVCLTIRSGVCVRCHRNKLMRHGPLRHRRGRVLSRCGTRRICAAVKCTAGSSRRRQEKAAWPRLDQ